MDQNVMDLLRRYSPMAKRVAKAFKRRVPYHVSVDDLLAAAMSGLWDAIRFHPEAGPGFEHYALVRIRGSIVDELRAQDWLPRRFRSSVKGGDRAPVFVGIDDMEKESFASSSNVEEEVYRGTWIRILMTSMDEVLNWTEKRIVFGHYIHGEKLRDIGKELGVSGPRVSQIRAAAIEKLRGVVPNLL
jgi:RNA polymerase sigma factor for flagellar operon FliA